MIRACGIVLAAVVAAGASPNVDVGGGDRRFEYAEPHMGTLVRIAFYARDEDAARRGSAAAFARIARLDETLSDYRDASELTQVSRASGSGPIVVGSDLFRVLEAAQRFARASGGAFDVTAGPLSVLWRQARRQQRLPDAARLAEARDRVGFDRMTLDAAARTVTLRDAGMQLDLGGIAKGFAADEALEALAAAGITRALVAAGGDVAAAEPPPGERGWRVTIATIAAGAPRALLLHDAAVSTSGDAEQFVVLGGTRYSHIFDPRSGMPLTGRRSVTVVARDAASSDALATAVSVMGHTAGLALVDGTAGAGASVEQAEADGRVAVFHSSRWRELTR